MNKRFFVSMRLLSASAVAGQIRDLLHKPRTQWDCPLKPDSTELCRPWNWHPICEHIFAASVRHSVINVLFIAFTQGSPSCDACKAMKDVHCRSHDMSIINPSSNLQIKCVNFINSCIAVSMLLGPWKSVNRWPRFKKSESWIYNQFSAANVRLLATLRAVADYDALTTLRFKPIEKWGNKPSKPNDVLRYYVQIIIFSLNTRDKKLIATHCDVTWPA